MRVRVEHADTVLAISGLGGVFIAPFANEKITFDTIRVNQTPDDANTFASFLLGNEFLGITREDGAVAVRVKPDSYEKAAKEYPKNHLGRTCDLGQRQPLPA